MSATHVTGDASGRLNQRIKALHHEGMLCSEMVTALNREFQLNLTPQGYRYRVTSLGLTWRGARATGGESVRMNARIRQLWEQKTPGREMVAIIKQEFGRDFSGGGAIYHRAEDMGLKVIRAQPRPAASRAFVPEEQQAACLEDPAWEARKKISDRIACRECFRFYKGGMRHHLKAQHGIDLWQYRELHPGARVQSFKSVGAQTGRPWQALMREFADLYATPEERAEATRLGEKYYDPGAKYVICCVPRCGLKATDGSHHFRSVHHISGTEYRVKYGLHLPVTSFAQLAGNRKRGTDRRAELAELRAKVANVGNGTGGTKKPGRKPDNEEGALVFKLHAQGLHWNVIKGQADKATGVHRSINGWQKVLERYRIRMKLTK